MSEAAAQVRIAAAQYPLERFETIEGCKAKLERWVGDAAGRGAQLLVFPEYGAMEYAGPAGAKAADLQASLGVVADAMAEMDAAHMALARRFGVHILAASGPFRNADGKFTNRARLFAPSGIVGVQDKLIMTPFERDWGIAAGDHLTVFDSALGKIGIAICYDSEFPLLVRALAEAEAEIILVPSCTEFVSGYHRVRTAALARALENSCVTVQSPTVGEAPWSPAVDRNAGAAGIYVPAERDLSETGIVAEGLLNTACWVEAVVDLARLRRVRTSGEMRNVADWGLQPGASPLAGRVVRKDLR